MASGFTDSSMPKIFSERAALLTARPSRSSRISSTARSRPVRGQQRAVQREGAADGVVVERPAVQRRAVMAVAAPDQRAGARFQLGQGEGLGEVVVGTEVQAAHAVFHGAMRGQDQHRHRVAPLAQAPQHFQAVQAGQADIEDGQRVILRGEQVVGAGAVVHAIDRKAALAQGLHEGGGQFQVVFGKAGYAWQGHDGNSGGATGNGNSA